MSGELPQFYFRVRENGAAVFRVDAENRQRRLDLVEIAAVNVRNGTIRPHGDRKLTADEIAAIHSWLADRQALLARREIDDILRTVDHLNLTAQWVQSRAEDDALDQVTDALLLAMHDLRTVLVRRKADRLARSAPPPAAGDQG
ncbi:MAG: hypothetical protein IE927_02225 [Rhodobacterales bacterium]|nr:hypothetical protein [Rhodobacterales bacterium]